jgi:hypothetical protein
MIEQRLRDRVQSGLGFVSWFRLPRNPQVEGVAREWIESFEGRFQKTWIEAVMGKPTYIVSA